MNEQEWKLKIPEMIMRYRQMEKIGGFMLQEVKWQYADMAVGGDGGSLGFIPNDEGWLSVAKPPSCREHNYPFYPDSFFQEVCDLMGWPR